MTKTFWCVFRFTVYFGHNATSSNVIDNTIEQLDLKYVGIEVGILSVGVL